MNTNIVGQEATGSGSAVVISNDQPELDLNKPNQYAESELEIRTHRIRSVIEKARGTIGDFIGGAFTKTKEFFTPHSRRIALASGVGAIAAGTAIQKARSRR